MKRIRKEYYLVSTSDYESFGQYILYGPKVADWNAFCISHIDEVIEEGKNQALIFQNQMDSDSIAFCLAKVLEKYGYEVIEFPESSWSGNYKISLLKKLQSDCGKLAEMD